MPTYETTDRYALIRRRSILVRRLDDGDRRIAAARESGADTERWEAFWLNLLDEYVDTSRLIDLDGGDALDIAA